MSDADECCICLDLISGHPTIATLNGCIHRFHFACIRQWSGRSNTCPACKGRFSLITEVSAIDGTALKTHNVRTRDLPTDSGEPTYPVPPADHEVESAAEEY